MAFSADDYLQMAPDSIEAAERGLATGDRVSAKRFFIIAILELLKSAVRRPNGWEALRATSVQRCLTQAARLDEVAHPTHLLDAAHVALLFGERALARAWLEQAEATPRWSNFWAFYARCLVQLIDQGQLANEAIPAEHPEQQLWFPYIELMRAVRAGSVTDAVANAVHEAFLARQTSKGDPGLLDGRPGDLILWDWRRDAILQASRIVDPRSD